MKLLSIAVPCYNSEAYMRKCIDSLLKGGEEVEILIVDDEPRIRDLIREHLQFAGYTCAEAGDGAAALTALGQGGIDLVILDIMMPFMDGMTCLREMRSRKINTPVIILTARSEEYDKLAGLEGGADDYVVKPFSPRELVARVRAVLRRCSQNVNYFTKNLIRD